MIMPDYDIKRWDESNSKIQDIKFIAEAYKAKKYAFVTDFIRLLALYNEGGIYLDTDVIVNKPFDCFLENEYFSAVEYHPSIIEKNNTFQLLNEDASLIDITRNCPGIGLLAAIIGSVPNHIFIKDCMDYYINRSFILSDGKFDMKVNPAVYAELAAKYGFKYKDTLQNIQNKWMVFYPSSIFAGEISQFNSESYALHYCENSWVDRSIYCKIKKLLKNNNFLRKLIHKEPYVINEIIKNLLNSRLN
jgi:mannosyltransferase OCH1-like enzyme